MNKILLHSLVDAPAPPDWMIQQAIALSPKGENGPKVMNNHGDDWTHRPLYKDGKEYRNSFNWSTRLDEISVEWAKNNITRIAKDVRSVHTTPGRERNGPHVDRSRNLTLIYLIEPGGPDHKTVFYKERGQEDIVRPWCTHVDDYNNVEELASFKLTVNRWNLMQGLVLHSIENIPEGRFNIQISLDEVPDDIRLENPTYIDL